MEELNKVLGGIKYHFKTVNWVGKIMGGITAVIILPIAIVYLVLSSPIRWVIRKLK